MAGTSGTVETDGRFVHTCKARSNREVDTVATIDWQTGYIGTAAWRAEERRRREERNSLRIAALTAAGIARGEGEFSACAAPCGGERAVRMGETIGTAYPPAPSHPRAARYIVGAAIGRHVREERRAAMQQARDVETARRMRLTSAQTAQTDETTLTDETAYVPPVADEWCGVPLRTLTALCETGWRAAGDILTQLETAYAVRTARTASMAMLMLAQSSGDGRGTWMDPRQRWGVNATEVRHSPRWHSTPADAVLDSDGRPIDRTCWRIVAPATGIGPVQRVPFVPPVQTEDTDDTAQHVRTVATDTAGAYAALLAAVGAVGNGETD